MLPTVEKRNWKIIYTDYSGIKAKAIDLVSRELGAHLNRDNGVFTLHVLPCIKTEEVPDCNVVVIGEYDDNAIIRKYVKKEWKRRQKSSWKRKGRKKSVSAGDRQGSDDP